MQDIYLNSKCINYRIYKDIFGFEDYLIQLPDNLRVVLTKFRCRNNKMPKEIGVRDNVPREQRICNLCHTGDIGDEFHYLFICKHVISHRKKYIPPFYPKHISTIKMHAIMNLNNINVLTNLALFTKIVMNILQSYIPGNLFGICKFTMSIYLCTQLLYVYLYIDCYVY